MPVLEHKGASIYYEEYGRGFPILTFAPGGLLSHIAAWSKPQSPINLATEWADHFRVIVMDQRNAPDGRSHAPITAADNWDTYAADHIALLDHLNLVLCQGHMTTATRNRILLALGALSSGATPLERAQTAILLTVTSPDGATQR